MPDLRRVVVVGTSCAGKSTFARRIASALEAHLIEADQLHWMRNWEQKPTEQLRTEVARATDRTRWVFDGNYAMVRDIVWPRATTIIWLDFPFPLVFSRALRRTLRRVWTREELFGGCRETFRQSFFSRDSILWWVITTFKRYQREYRALLGSGRWQHAQAIILRHPRKAEAFLRDHLT